VPGQVRQAEAGCGQRQRPESTRRAGPGRAGQQQQQQQPKTPATSALICHRC